MELLPDHGIDVEVRTLLERDQAEALYQPGFQRKMHALVVAAARRVGEVATARTYDIVMVHREAFPLGPPLFESAVAGTGTPLVFDFDDAIYLPNVSEVNRRFGWLKMPGKTQSVVKRATVVIAGNHELATWARRSNPRVEIIPTTIDTDSYLVPARNDPNRQLCIGWSGSRTTIQHLEALTGVLREVQQKTGVRLKVIGDEDYAIPGASVESSAWSEEGELSELSEIDVGVMPLPDDPWARGKCGLKALQYMALGIATVMSPVGVNREIAGGGAALLASTDAEWREALTRLTEDAGFRLETGARGRQRVEERYSTRTNVQRYADVFTEARELSLRRS